MVASSFCHDRKSALMVLGIIALTAYKENQPADYKSETGTVNHEPDLLSREISLCIYVLILQMNYCLSLSLRFRLAVSESPYFSMH